MSGGLFLIECEIQMVHHRGQRLYDLLAALERQERREGWWGEGIDELEEAHAAFEQFPPKAWWRQPS